MTDPTKEAAFKEYTLERDCELRFEIESKTQVVVEVCWFVYISPVYEIKNVSIVFSSRPDSLNFMERNW